MKLLFAFIYIFLITTISSNAFGKGAGQSVTHKIKLDFKSDRIESIHLRNDGQYAYLKGVISKEWGVDFSKYLIEAICTDHNDKVIDQESTHVSGSDDLLRKRTTANFIMRIKDRLKITKCDISVTD